MRAAAWALALGALLAHERAARAADDATEIATFPVTFHVAQDDGEPVREDAWLDEQIANAEALFGPRGVHLRKASRRYVGSLVADRDALLSLTRPGVINVFVVKSLKDVDEANRFRMGVHWRPEAHKDRRFIILAANARPSVLAHELGHYFGNPHSPVADNVMSYERTGGPIFFDDAQTARIRAVARQCLATREIIPASK